MAAGDITQAGPVYSLRLLTGVTTNNGAPSGASAGVALSVLDALIGPYGLVRRKTHIRLWSSAGSDTMTVEARLWGYDPTAARWVPCGIGQDATKGYLNDGLAMGESGTDLIMHTQEATLLHTFTRLYVQTLNIGGTATAIEAALIVDVVAGD